MPGTMAARMTCSMNRVQVIAATMAPIVFLVSAAEGDADHPETGRGDHRAQVEPADSGREVMDPVRRQRQDGGAEPESEAAR